MLVSKVLGSSSHNTILPWDHCTKPMWVLLLLGLKQSKALAVSAAFLSASISLAVQMNKGCPFHFPDNCNISHGEINTYEHFNRPAAPHGIQNLDCSHYWLNDTGKLHFETTMSSQTYFYVSDSCQRIKEAYFQAVLLLWSVRGTIPSLPHMAFFPQSPNAL